MIIKASATLRNDYSTISNLARATSEPIYITKNGEGDGVFMNIDAFEKREQALELRAKIMQAEEERLNGAKTTAWEDLKSIEDYYLLQFGVESAMKVTDQILNSIERLELYPNFGSLTPDKWLNRKGYHMIISERYVSIYRLIEKTVYIYHIADTQTEYTKLFS